METPGDDVTAHPSRKRRKSASAGPTALLDMPGTHEEELRRKRKKEKKKRRIEAECMETMKLEDDGGRGQEPASEEAGQSTSQETTQRKKKKKKKKKELVVIDDEEEEDEGDKDSEVSAVIETSITKKGALAKSKKKNEKKKKSVVVTEAMDDNTPEAALSKERPESDLVAPHGALLGVAPLCKEKKRRGRKKEQDNIEELESGEYLEQMKELLLYIPDAKTRSSEVIVKMLRQDLPRFREFKAKGIELRWGRFLKWENLKIKENVANFLALTGIETASQLFYPERYTGQMDIIKRLRVQHSFMHRIAEGIPRPCYKVHTRARKTFDDLNYLGRFSEDENLQLQKLQRIHGNDWKTISNGMDRSSYSVQKRFDMLTTTLGPWSQEEVDILLGAMKLHLERLAGENQPGSGDDGAADAGSGPEKLWLTKRQLYNKLPWKSISEKVTSRSWLQCREKWFSILKTKLSTHNKEVGGGGSQSVLSKINLINTLYMMDLEDAAEIDWEQVADCLGNLTPHHAQKIFNCLKMTRVPHSSVLSFCELIDFLHDKVIPMLRNKLNQMADSCPLPQEEEVQNKYLLSNIFSDEEYMELDNTA